MYIMLGSLIYNKILHFKSYKYKSGMKRKLQYLKFVLKYYTQRTLPQLLSTTDCGNMNRCTVYTLNSDSLSSTKHKLGDTAISVKNVIAPQKTSRHYKLVTNPVYLSQCLYVKLCSVLNSPILLSIQSPLTAKWIQTSIQIEVMGFLLLINSYIKETEMFLCVFFTF